MTYSIVALDPATGDLGVATQSRFLAVGAVVPWARAGVGAVATQAFANVRWGVDALDRLAAGDRTSVSAEAVLAELVAADELRAERQVGIVDAHGGSATHTGPDCFAWAGGRTGPGFAAQGNILAGPGVVNALVETFTAAGPAFPELLIACLAAADEAGGDRRGRESAALLVVRADGGYGGGNDRWIDLRVDHADDPIGELRRLLDLRHLYFDRPVEDDLVAIDEWTGAELRSILEGLGAAPGGRFEAAFQPMSGPREDRAESRPSVGEPRELPPNWDARWQRALDDWMAVENLEERSTAPGWIDQRVLAILRDRAATRA